MGKDLEARTFEVGLVSDFNLATFSGYLCNDSTVPATHATLSGPGPVVPALLAPALGDVESPDVLMVWTRPEGVIESFGHALEFESPGIDDILGEVDSFAAALCTAAQRVPTVLVPSWVTATVERGLGVLDLAPGGIADTLSQMNRRLAERTRASENIWLLNTQKWVEAAGPDAFDPRYWYAAKIPFAPAVLKQAVADVKAALAGFAGLARKLVVVDLDDTLWGGVVGDAGWEKLRLGGHDPIGEAFVDFQRSLKALQRRGVALGIVSKNEESVALEALRKHPEMQLRPEDFAGWRINWNDKAANLVELVKELNLGLDSVVFIDDNPAERARVASALPDVLVPEWPKDRLHYKRALASLRCFDSPTQSEEDATRAAAYRAEAARRSARESIGSLDAWLESLELRVHVEPLEAGNAARAAQLLNKTNQMNLSTRRLTSEELLRWQGEGDRTLWCFRVVDRFGDAGLTGIASVELDGEVATLVDFVLSCRVFGRQIERVMVQAAVAYARERGAQRVEARYRETGKNKPCLDFWLGSGFERAADQRFCWPAARPFATPSFIEVTLA